MLTINPDMHLKSLSPICSLHSPLCEKILSDYSLIQAEFTPEDLLHLVTQPADLFFAEGNVSNFITDNRTENLQNVKIDVINNLVNRIVHYSENKLNYRDTVYVEATLRKLGITNVQEFMNEVKRLQTDVNNTDTLIELYAENLTEIKNLVSMTMQDEDVQKSAKSEEQGAGSRYYIHNDIYDRLDTANIYQELSLIYGAIPGEEENVSELEMGIAEQLKVSENIILHNLQNYVRNETQPMLTRTYNVYEEGDRLSLATSRKDVIENMISAVVLNYVDRAYTYYTNNAWQQRENWFDFSNTMYGAAANSFERLESIFNGAIKNTFVTNEQLLAHTQVNAREIELLTEMVHVSKNMQVTQEIIDEIDERTLEYVNRYRVNHGNYSNQTETNISAEGDVVFVNPVTAQITNEEVKNIAVAEINSALTNINAKNNENHTVVNSQNQTVDAGKSVTNVKKTSETTLINPVTNQVTQEEVREISATEIKNALTAINAQNLENLAFITNQRRILSEATQTPLATRQQIIRETLDALENGAETVLSHVTTDEVRREAIAEYERQVSSIMSEETKAIFRLVEEYFKNPAAVTAGGQAVNASTGMLTAAAEMVNKVTENVTNEIDEATSVINKSAQEITNVYLQDKAATEDAKKPTKETFLGPEMVGLKYPADEGTSSDEAYNGPLLQNEVLESVTENVSKPYDTQRIVNEVLTPRVVSQVNRRAEEQHQENLDLVHKVTDQVIDTEEVFEELRRQTANLQRNVEEIKSETVNRTVTQVGEYNYSTTRVNEVNTENIESYIDRGVRSNMDEIAEQVFSKLEKRLLSEQKRRGF